ISRANLQECQRQLAANGFNDFFPIEIDAGYPQAVLENVAQPVDFFLSTAVFQHFPSQLYGRHIVEIAYKLLADDGIALIQTRYDDGTDTFKSKSDDYQNNVGTFTSYRIEEFWQLASEAGFEPLAVKLLQPTRYAYYLLSKSKVQK
ncbi:MAG TPA: hypothetical protein VKK61_09825, partial [Tepidisphaeraceae bacterium]|nr:hypothetical protein [Tepidisphaeraceae bacterium]